MICGCGCDCTNFQFKEMGVNRVMRLGVKIPGEGGGVPPSRSAHSRLKVWVTRDRNIRQAMVFPLLQTLNRCFFCWTVARSLFSLKSSLLRTLIRAYATQSAS